MKNSKKHEPHVKKFIGEQVRILRIQKGLTQKELGKLVGLENNSISAIERGANSITPTVIFKFAEIFNIRADDLFPPLEIENDGSDYLFRYALRNTKLEAREVVAFKEMIELTNKMTELEKKQYIENLQYAMHYFKEIHCMDEKE